MLNGLGYLGMQGIIGIRDGVLKTSGKTNPSARDFVKFSGRGQTADAIVGGPLCESPLRTGSPVPMRRAR